MPPRFRTRATSAAVAPTPERLYDDLPHTQAAPKALWAHQVDVLWDYHGKHLSTPDVALAAARSQTARSCTCTSRTTMMSTVTD